MIAILENNSGIIEIGEIPEYYVRIIAYNKVLDILSHESYYNGVLIENGN